MGEEIAGQIQVQVTRAGWLKRSYQFIADGKAIAQLSFESSFHKKATANVDGKEFLLRRGGFWKHYIEITSTSYQSDNRRIDVNWRSKMKITDAAGNPFVFKSTSIWKNKWTWLDRHERPIIEIRSKVLSRKNRGRIEIKHPEIKDTLFWIIVSWFAILCSEADATAAST
jgi:hypothetical protein